MKSRYLDPLAMDLILPLLLTTFLITSCGEGEVGPTGQPGPQGATGAKGDKGDPGAANVITSEWLEYTFEYDISAFRYEVIIPAPELTQEILDKGVIKMYLNKSNIIYDIPSLPWEGLHMAYKVGNIYLYSQKDWDTGTGNFTVRYVLIPSE
jgi:hypothetical protein